MGYLLQVSPGEKRIVTGSWNPDVRRRYERSPGAEDQDRTSGHKMPGSVVIRMERRMIRRAATENQRCSGRKSRGPGPVRAQKTLAPCQDSVRAGRSGDAESGRNVRSTLRPD